MFIDEGSDLAETALQAFLEAWSENDYAAAYDLLASSSPLRQGLPRDAWIIRHQSWAEEAQPSNMRFDIVTEEDDTDTDASNSNIIVLPKATPVRNTEDTFEVFWSIEMTDASLNSTLKELPIATVVYQEIGRHWFWSRFTLVEEEGEWHIQDMFDEGKAAQRLTTEDLHQRMDVLAESVKSLAQEFGIEDIEDEGKIEDIIQKVEDEQFSFEDLLGQVQEIGWITQRAMYYSDALIKKTPDDVQVYETAVAQATTMDEWERAAAYLDLIIQRFPDKRGPALRTLATALASLASEYEEERAQHFIELVEKILRASIEADHHPAAYTMLADLLIDEEERLDEAQTLLKEAQTRATNPSEQAAVEYSFGKLAEIQDNMQEALGHFLQTIQLDERVPGAWTSLGNAQRALGQNKEAIQSYQRALETDPESLDAYVELALIYIEQNKTAEARKLLEDGLSLFPDEPELYAAFAIAEIQSGNLRNAEEYLDMAEEIDADVELVQDARLLLNQVKAQRKALRPKSKGPNQNKPKQKK